jgi:hypothetical protein
MTRDVQRARRRLNLAILLIPQQWITLTVLFWLQRLLRPNELVWGMPPGVVLLGASALSVLPVFLPGSYFRPRTFERRLYSRLGVRIFRRLAPDGDWVNRRLRRIDPAYRVVRDAETRARHLAGSIVNERWHLSWLLFGLVTQAVAYSRGALVYGTLMTVLNVVFNLYPVFHQRDVRSRAYRVSTGLHASGVTRSGSSSG